jgi:hypothetical protein
LTTGYSYDEFGALEQTGDSDIGMRGAVSLNGFQDDSQASGNKGLKGLGGWLILFQILVLYNLVMGVYILYLKANGEQNVKIDAWFVICLVLIAASVVLFYCRLKLFRITYLAAVLINLIYGFIHFEWPVNGMIIWDILTPVLGGILIIGGLFTSKRVKNTFR